MVRLIVCGVFGRMGKAVQELVLKTENVRIVAGVVNKETYTLAGSDDSPQCKTSPGFPIYTSIDEINTHADCVVSFLPPTALDANQKILSHCAKLKLPVIICTTGLPDDFIGEMNKASEETAVLYSANVSYGMNLVSEILERYSESLLNEGFDAEIIEAHHGRKIDAPSGTALKHANTITKAVEGNMELVYDRSKRHEKRKKNEIGIHTIRGGGIFGDHKIVFASEYEVIEISHRAINRQVFAKGAIKAAMFLSGKPPGMYTMKDII